MPSLTRIGLLAADTSRTRAYLDAMAKDGWLPGHVILVTGKDIAGGGPASARPVPYFDNVTPVDQIVERLSLSCETIAAADVNEPAVVDAVERSDTDVLIYSGPGGALVGKALLASGKRFLHVHPGLLPAFRGSTTVYYSLLLTGRCGVTAIFLDQRIDGGPIIAEREYDPPADRSTLDYGYDPYIRADLLVRVLRDYRLTGEFVTRPQRSEGGRTYFIMHPVLRHAAILARPSGPEGV